VTVIAEEWHDAEEARRAKILNAMSVAEATSQCGRMERAYLTWPKILTTIDLWEFMDTQPAEHRWWLPAPDDTEQLEELDSEDERGAWCAYTYGCLCANA